LNKTIFTLSKERVSQPRCSKQIQQVSSQDLITKNLATPNKDKNH